MKEIKIPEKYKYIAAFISMRCNLGCSFCLNAFNKNFSRNYEEISGEKWVDALNKINPKKGIPITLCGGEPSLHKDFIDIINNLKPELEIDILTNLQWSKSKFNNFIKYVNPDKIKRDSIYPSIRVSYHPEQMGNGDKLIENVLMLKKEGFDIGIESVMYPLGETLSAIEQIAIKCRNKNISFRPKSFTGKFEGLDDKGNKFSIKYGNYSKYENSAFNEEISLDCLCKTSELILGPEGNVYRCHRDLFAREYSIGNITEPNFQIKNIFRECSKYGQCHPCDVKVKTNNKQKLGHTSVDIKRL
jgi:radical SAM protein with 4Fe4S-binding SPASM domain